MAPTTALHKALDETEAHADFARLGGASRVLLTQVVLACGRELVLTGNGGDRLAARLVTGFTHSGRLGEAASRAVRIWAGRRSD